MKVIFDRAWEGKSVVLTFLREEGEGESYIRAIIRELRDGDPMNCILGVDIEKTSQWSDGIIFVASCDDRGLSFEERASKISEAEGVIEAFVKKAVRAQIEDDEQRTVEANWNGREERSISF